jgi:hypothetical protein
MLCSYVVNCGEIRSLGRWFYMGKAEEAETYLANDTKMLERASKAVRNAATMVAEEKKRVADMIKSGEVRPIAGMLVVPKEMK